MPVWKKFEAPVLEEVTNYIYEIQSTSSNQLYGFIIPIMYRGTSIQGTPSGLNRDVSSIAVTDTKIMWMFFWEQSLCVLNEGVSWIEVSQRRGSTVYLTIIPQVRVGYEMVDSQRGV